MDKIFSEIQKINRLIHEPSRLAIMAILHELKEADFLYLLNTTGLTRGNLSAHITKLEEAGYIQVEKKFVGKKPKTIYRLTEEGRKAFRAYINSMKDIIGGL